MSLRAKESNRARIMRVQLVRGLAGVIHMMVIR